MFAGSAGAPPVAPTVASAPTVAPTVASQRAIAVKFPLKDGMWFNICC